MNVKPFNFEIFLLLHTSLFGSQASTQSDNKYVNINVHKLNGIIGRVSYIHYF